MNKQHVLKTKQLLYNFFVQEKAVVAIEMAFIVPVLILLSMGILEFAILMSVRSGLEEVNRQISRMKQAIEGNNDTTLSQALYNKVKDVVIDITKVTVKTYTSPSVANQPEFYQMYFVAGKIGTTNFKSNVTLGTSAPPINFGQPKDYVAVEILYEHRYLTPIGRLAGMGASVTMQTLTTFQKEDDII